MKRRFSASEIFGLCDFILTKIIQKVPAKKHAIIGLVLRKNEKETLFTNPAETFEGSELINE